MSSDQLPAKTEELSDLVTEEEQAGIIPPQPLDFEAAFELFDIARELRLERFDTQILFDAYNAVRQYGIKGWQSVSNRVSQYVGNSSGGSNMPTYTTIKTKIFEMMGYSVSNPEELDPSRIEIEPIAGKQQRFTQEGVSARLQYADGFTAWNISHGNMAAETGDACIEDTISAILIARKLNSRGGGAKERFVSLLGIYNEAKTGNTDTDYIESRLRQAGVEDYKIKEGAEAIQLDIYRAELAAMQGTRSYDLPMPIRLELESITCIGTPTPKDYLDAIAENRDKLPATTPPSITYSVPEQSAAPLTPSGDSFL